MKTDIIPRYLSVIEAAKYLSMHASTLRKLSADGAIKPCIIPASGSRLFLRFDMKDLDRFMELRKGTL